MMKKRKSPSKASLFIAIAIIGVFVLVALPMIYFSTASRDAKTVSDEKTEETEDYAVISPEENDVLGNWDCSKGEGNMDDQRKYITRLELNADMTFRYGKYNDLDNNHYAGVYTYVNGDAKDENGIFKGYTVKLRIDEYVVMAEKQESDVDKTNMDMSIATTVDGETRAIVIFASKNDTMYYCYKNDSEVMKNEH